MSRVIAILTIVRVLPKWHVNSPLRRLSKAVVPVLKKHWFIGCRGWRMAYGDKSQRQKATEAI